jgi:Mg-chelatase subunit ChlD
MPRHITIGPNQFALVVTNDKARVLGRLTDVTDPYLNLKVANLDRQVGGTGTNYSAGLRLALDLLADVPTSWACQILLVADGADNRERDQLDAQVERARQLGVRIYTLPIGSTQAGHTFDFQRLKDIAARTRGATYTMRATKEMADTFRQLAARGGHALGRSVAKVLVVDVSPSMGEAFDRTTKIEALKLAVIRLLEIERKRQ